MSIAPKRLWLYKRVCLNGIDHKGITHNGMEMNRMKNTCSCIDACVHVTGAGAVSAARFEQRESSLDDSGATEQRLVSPEDEERFVASILRQAANDSDRTEFAGEASVSAYEGLAASRGVSLERVARAAAKGELRDIVRLPGVSPEDRRRS